MTAILLAVSRPPPPPPLPPPPGLAVFVASEAEDVRVDDGELLRLELLEAGVVVVLDRLEVAPRGEHSS